MSIKIKNLKENDKGRWVEYTRERAGSKSESGRIKNWNDIYIFVVYKCDENWDDFMNYTGCATSPGQLRFIQPPKESQTNA